MFSTDGENGHNIQVVGGAGQQCGRVGKATECTLFYNKTCSNTNKHGTNKNCFVCASSILIKFYSVIVLGAVWVA